MVDAVVYESHTGFTRMYARMLAWELGVEPVCSVKEAEKKVPLHAEVVFLGWICSGKVMGYEDAARSFRILAVCAVGIMFPREGLAARIAADSRISGCPVFYMQGGYRHDQQGLVYRTMMKLMASNLMAKNNKTEEDYKLLHIIREGVNMVDEEELIPVTEYLHSLFGLEGQNEKTAENGEEES